MSRARPRRTQRGWAGLVVLLLALVIVALLARQLLGRMGLSGTSSPLPQPAVPGAAAAPDAAAMPSGPAGALEAARSVEGLIQRQKQETERRLDAAEK